MSHDFRLHRRRSIRLSGYDYAQAGVYFVTACTKNGECMLGDIVDGAMILNDLGRIADDEWSRSAALRDEIELDAWVVMPNHIHGVVIINPCHPAATFVGAYGATIVGAYGHTPLRDDPRVVLVSPSKTIGAMVRGFKSAATRRINERRDTPGAPVWQRNYYEHIVRDERELDEIRRYIRDNPARWSRHKS